MHFTFITLFPEIFENILNSSILGRSLKKDVFSFSCVNIRDFAIDLYGHVDDTPYGGGPGMVIRADVLEKALAKSFELRSLNLEVADRFENLVVVTAAAGTQYTQGFAEKFKSFKNIFIICGHYEGIDQRFIDLYADYEISLGQYVLTGGELPAMIIADSIVRLLPGALGDSESVSEESFSFSDEQGLLPEYPHYTRPDTFKNTVIPDVLKSGNHAKIKEWRMAQSRIRREKLSK
jgi:tRNA (guanine37-N1)-methyltransferase